jgi:hypothetical protein
VFAVAVAFAKIVIAFVTVAAFELEILDLCRILLVANPRPNRSDEGLRYLPANPTEGCLEHTQGVKIPPPALTVPRTTQVSLHLI